MTLYTLSYSTGVDWSRWTVYEDSGRVCVAEVVSTNVRAPHVDKCLEFCENYQSEFCMVEKKENKGHCMATSKCDQLNQPNNRNEAYTIYRGPAYTGKPMT